MYWRNVTVLTGVAIGTLTRVPVCKVETLTTDARITSARLYRRNVTVLTGVTIGTLTRVPVRKVETLTTDARVAGARLDDRDLTVHPSEAGSADTPEACQEVQALATIKARVTYTRKGYDGVTVLTSKACSADASIRTNLIETITVDARVTEARLCNHRFAVEAAETSVANTQVGTKLIQAKAVSLARVAEARLQYDVLAVRTGEPRFANATVRVRLVDNALTIDTRVTLARLSHDQVAVLSEITRITRAAVGISEIETLTIDARITGTGKYYIQLTVFTRELTGADTSVRVLFDQAGTVVHTRVTGTGRDVTVLTGKTSLTVTAVGVERQIGALPVDTRVT